MRGNVTQEAWSFIEHYQSTVISEVSLTGSHPVSSRKINLGLRLKEQLQRKALRVCKSAATCLRAKTRLRRSCLQ